MKILVQSQNCHEYPDVSFKASSFSRASKAEKNLLALLSLL